MEKDHAGAVAAQFGPQARAYVESAVHAGGADLEALGAIPPRSRPPAPSTSGRGRSCRLSDGAPCGRGGGGRPLLRDAGRRARHGHRARDCQSETAETAAERLPFADASFDFLACRYSAHHWLDLGAGLSEARRVLAPGSRAVFIDVIAAGRPLLDTHLQAVELLRDTSHVRDYSAAEWLAALGRAGFTVGGCERGGSAWIFRSGPHGCAHPRRSSPRSGHFRRPPRPRHARILRSRRTDRSSST